MSVISSMLLILMHFVPEDFKGQMTQLRTIFLVVTRTNLIQLIEVLCKRQRSCADIELDRSIASKALQAETRREENKRKAYTIKQMGVTWTLIP